MRPHPGQRQHPRQNLQRSENSWLSQEGFWAQTKWSLCGDPRTPQLWWRPMVKCKQTRKHKKTFTILISSWRCKYSMTLLQFHHVESSAKNTDLPLSGPAVKSHAWPNKGRRFSARRKFRTICSPWIVVKILVPARLLHRYRRIHQVQLQVQQQRKWRSDTKNPKTKLKERQRWSIEIAKPFRMVRGVHGKSRRYRSACTCTHFSWLGVGTAYKSGIQGAQCEKTHFPKDRNCEVCSRTKMTRALCRRRIGEAALRAEKFGDLITADHKVFNEESRNNHRYTDNSLEFGKSFEDLHGIIELLHLIRAVRRINKERLLYCCNQAWMKNGGLILWNVIAVCDMFKTSSQTGKLFTKDDSVNHWKAPVILFGAMVEYYPTREGSTNLARKFHLGMLLGYALTNRGGVNLERRNFGHMHWALDASEICPRRLNAKEVLTPHRGEHFLFSVADGSNKFCGRDHEFREPTPRGNNLRGVKIREENFEANQKECQPAESTDDAEARADFWSIQGEFINRHHNEPRFQLYVPKEETFSSSLEYIDVTRSTHTDLDVSQEIRIDDYWNVDSSKHLSWSLQKDTCAPRRDWEKFKRLYPENR